MAMFVNTGDGKFIGKGIMSESGRNPHFSEYNNSVGGLVASILMFLGALCVFLAKANDIAANFSADKNKNNRVRGNFNNNQNNRKNGKN